MNTLRPARSGIPLCLLLLPALCAAAADPVTLPIGAPAPDFNLPGVDGKNHALSDFADAKVLVINFTCNHCPTAQQYEERTRQLVEDYKDRGVALVAISSSSPGGLRLDEMGWTDLDDSFASMKIRARDRKYNYPYLYDGDAPQAVCTAYGPVATPHYFVFDQARKLRYAGRFDDDERGRDVRKRFVADAIDALLAGREPPVTTTKVAGCSTKWAGKADQVKAFMEKLAAEPVTVEKVDAAGLADLRKNTSGKTRLVTFWGTWCAPCVAEFPEFVTINRMYRHRAFELVTVAVNDPADEPAVLDFLKKQQASNRNLIFASKDRDVLIDAFDPDWQGEVPLTVLITPEGKVAFRATGAVDPLELRRAVLRELDARKPW